MSGLEIVPRSVSFATAALSNFARGRYRLETAGSTSAGPSSIVTVTLPSHACCDLRSFRLHMRLTTTGDSTNSVFAKLPADASSLIQSVEVYIGGVQVQSCNEYNQISRILKTVRSSRDRDGSVDSLCSHGLITSDDAVDDVDVVISDWKGFLGESSTRMLPTNITSDCTIRISFAPTSVLAFKQSNVSIGGNFTNSASRAAAALLTYSVSNIHATIDTINLGPAYEAMLRQRLQSEEFLPLNFKEYLAFNLHGTTGNAHSVKFSVSASSINKCYAVFRDSNCISSGIKTQLYQGVSNTDASCANAFFYKSFNDSNDKIGSLRYHWTCANVRMPQYDATILDAAADLSLLEDQISTEGRGHMVTSLKQFNNGSCVLPLCLDLPGQGINVTSGWNSKGTSTQMSLEVSGQTPPTSAAASGVTASISTLVIVETTAQLRISGNSQVGVSF